MNVKQILQKLLLRPIFLLYLITAIPLSLFAQYTLTDDDVEIEDRIITSCSADLCACHPYSQFATHVCSCDSHCSTCSTGHYWHPN